MKITVRASRAYLAGFGTSGSLLAGAALLFVLSSAIVAFRGWPQIATGPAAVSVVSARSAGPGRVAPRLAAILKSRLVTGGAAVAPPFGHRRALGVRGAFVKRVPVSSIGAPVSGTASAVRPAGAPCAASACTKPGGPGLVSALTNSVAQAVTSIGSAAGSGVSAASGAVGASVSGASPQAATAVQSAGSSAGNGISGTATTVAGTVSQAGNTLGGH